MVKRVGKRKGRGAVKKMQMQGDGFFGDVLEGLKSAGNWVVNKGIPLAASTAVPLLTKAALGLGKKKKKFKGKGKFKTQKKIILV